MIRTIEFKDFRSCASTERNDCIVLRRLDWVDGPYITIAFPFHEDTPNFTLTVPELLNLRNAIDDMTVVKMLGEPQQQAGVHKVSALTERDIARLQTLVDEYPLRNDFDRGARQALHRVFIILEIDNSGGTNR